MAKDIRVLVTGGAGFIGSHLVDRLVKKNCDVMVMDDLSGGFIRNVNKRADLFLIDARNPDEVKKMIEWFKPEIIYHLAANAAENKAQFSPYDISTRNYDTFLTLIGPAINNGLKRFVFTSSIAVYGNGKPPFLELDKPEPEDIYGVSKLAVEQSLKILSEVHGFEYVIARPHNVYGPRQNMSDPYRNVVTIFMNSILKNKPYYIYGDGMQVRCFTYIDGVADALFECGFRDVAGKTFNIGADTEYTLKHLSDIIMKITGFNKPPVYLPKRLREVDFVTADHKLAKLLLGYKDKVTLEKGIKRTWKYARELGYQELL